MDAGGLPVFPPNGNQSHQLNNPLSHLQQQHLQTNQHQFQPQHQQNIAQGIATICQQPENLPPKRQAVVDRLRRRIENYRRRQSDCVPRFDQTFSGVCEQQNLETNALQKRYLESKAKRAQKKTDKKQQDTNLAGNLQSSVHVQKTFLKRSADDIDNNLDSYEPPVKLQHQSENLTKFSVEIVQQLEFTTSAANSQPQQISTNVTVKALTNTSVKSENGNLASQQTNTTSTTSNNQPPNNNSNKSKSPSPSDNLGHLIECKQEPENDFADLEAALEKDAAANGHFSGLSDLIGDDTNDESETFKELISDLTDFNPELLNFEQKPLIDIKIENDKPDLLDNMGCIKTNSPMTQFSTSNYNDELKQRMQYNQSNVSNSGIGEMIPAAQKLKHMAEQHQHKHAIKMNFVRPPQPQTTNSRSPYREFNQYGSSDFMGNPQQMSGFPKNSNNTNFSNPDLIKQEILYSPTNEFDLKRMGQMGPNTKIPPSYKQQYSPYGSPMSNHGSPVQNYMPQRNSGPSQSTQGPPPRPSSGPGTNNQGGTTLQMKQTQQLHITNHGMPGHGIQVSAGQHMHLSSEFKNGVSIATQQQNVFFSQQQTQPNTNSGPTGNPRSNQTNNSNIPVSSQQQQTSSDESYIVTQSQSINFNQQSVRQRPPQAQQNTTGASQSQHQQQNSGNVNLNQINSNLNTQTNQMSANSGTNNVGNTINNLGINNNTIQNTGIGSLNNLSSCGNNGLTNQSNLSMPQTNDITTLSQSQHLSVNTMGNLINTSSGNTNITANFPNTNTTNTNLMTNGVISGSNSNINVNNANNLGNGTNFAHNINQNVIGMKQNMNSANEMGINPLNMGNIPIHLRQEQASFMQQQQMMRSTQMMQQNMGGNRPPPPEYKASQSQLIQAQMMHSGRFPNTTAIRRMGTQQAMPPSGPHLRPQHPMYIHHSNMTGGRGLNSQYGCNINPQRPPNVQVIPEGLPLSSQQEWRHLIMSQQQSMSFASPGNGNIRPGFQSGQGGFMGTPTGNMGISPNSMQQHSVMRQNQSNTILVNGINQNNSMQQQILPQHQQNSQQNMINQMQLNAVHMSQTQSMSMQQQQSVINTFNHQNLQHQSTSPMNITPSSAQQQQSSQNLSNNQNLSSSQQASTTSSLNVNNTDFSLEFLENLPVGDTSNFSAQDLLNSLENDSFNFQDILQ